MAIFARKKNTEVAADAKAAKAVVPKEKKAKAPAKAVAVVSKAPAIHDAGAHVVVRPRITEKATVLSESGVYTFEVTERATKATISEAVRSLYKVTPAKIAIVNLPRKNVVVRGKRGVRAGVRKAYVYLKKGDKIEIV